MYDIKSKYNLEDKTKKIFYASVPMEPYTKANRMQIAGKFAFIPKKFKDMDKMFLSHIQEAMKAQGTELFTGPCLMHFDYYRSNKRRWDLSNGSKAVCDVVNGVLYEDDSQIVVLTECKFYDKLNPRIEVYLEQLDIEHPLVKGS